MESRSPDGRTHARSAKNTMTATTATITSLTMNHSKLNTTSTRNHAMITAAMTPMTVQAVRLILRG